MPSQDELDRLLAAGDPALGADADDWAQSEAGRRVWHRIRVAPETPSVVPHRWPAHLRPYLVGLAASCLAIIIALTCLLVAKDPGEVPTVVTAPSTPAPAPLSQQVALVDIILVASLAGHLEEQPIAYPVQNPSPELARAVRLGLIHEDEIGDYRASAPVTRIDFALWLWRALGQPSTTTSERTFADLDGLGPDQIQAAAALAEMGIFLGFPDGTFQPSRPLTPTQSMQVLTRVAARAWVDGPSKRSRHQSSLQSAPS